MCASGSRQSCWGVKGRALPTEMFLAHHEHQNVKILDTVGSRFVSCELVCGMTGVDLTA